jgi:hypothetical protein
MEIHGRTTKHKNGKLGEKITGISLDVASTLLPNYPARKPSREGGRLSQSQNESSEILDSNL